MRILIRLTLLASTLICVGCQREYISSDDPNFPLKKSQISTAKWTNEKLHDKAKAEKLKNLAPPKEIIVE